MKPCLFVLCAVLLLTGPAYGQPGDDATTSGATASLALKERIRQNARETLEAINQAYRSGSHTLDVPADAFTRDGLESLTNLWHFTRFYCARIDVDSPVILRGDSLGYEMRRFPMVLEQGPESSQRTDGVLVFSLDGLIDEFRFGLDLHQEGLVLDAARNVTEFRQRQVILDFVEKYRTAYTYKDLPFIEKVFSDNALIIVGKVVEVAEDRDGAVVQPMERVEYVRRTKDQYLSRLREVFDGTSTINVAFDSLDVFQHPEHPDIYAVTLLQHWNTSSYSDRGYVFLMIDFKDQTNPIIHVRTWQPEALTPRRDVFSLGDFEIIR